MYTVYLQATIRDYKTINVQRVNRKRTCLLIVTINTCEFSFKYWERNPLFQLSCDASEL